MAAATCSLAARRAYSSKPQRARTSPWSSTTSPSTEPLRTAARICRVPYSVAADRLVAAPPGSPVWHRVVCGSLASGFVSGLGDVEPLDVRDLGLATALVGLQRRAYAVEATLVGHDGIPQLTETV